MRLDEPRNSVSQIVVAWHAKVLAVYKHARCNALFSTLKMCYRSGTFEIFSRPRCGCSSPCLEGVGELYHLAKAGMRRRFVAGKKRTHLRFHVARGGPMPQSGRQLQPCQDPRWQHLAPQAPRGNHRTVRGLTHFIRGVRKRVEALQCLGESGGMAVNEFFRCKRRLSRVAFCWLDRSPSAFVFRCRRSHLGVRLKLPEIAPPHWLFAPIWRLALATWKLAAPS